MSGTSQPQVPQEFQLQLTARSSFSFTFEHTAALPTGVNIRFTARKTKYSLTPAIAVDGTTAIAVVGNVATVTVSAVDTDLACGWYTWLLEITSAGQEIALAGGLLEVRPSPA